MAFAHLHTHSEYSLLDGMSRVKEIPKHIKSLGMDSVALTDHGAMFGIIDFYKACKDEGVHPVIGCEVYTAARRMTDKDSNYDRHSGHLILLAETNEGYHNLMKIDSEAYIKGLYYKPRVDKELLRKYHKGIICLSACLAGKVQYKLLIGDYDGAKKEALELLDIFGENNFFLEIQNHGLPEDRNVIEGLLKLSKDTGIPLVATNDSHYTRKEDAKAHDVLLAIATNADVDADDRLTFATEEFYLKSEEEMRELFPEAQDAIDRSEEIAKRCNVDIKFGEYHIPNYEPPEGFTTKEYLRKLCLDGLKNRYGEKEALNLESVPRKRLEKELSVIELMGYVEYFLIVWDFINYAKTKGIPVGPGRGSAAGSVVSYALRITEVDPIKYNLIFERFLNPERISMPDIDIDFDIEMRQEVIDYVIKKYGKENVGQIITFGKLKAKMAIRDVARALGASYAEGDAIAKSIPNVLNITISDALKINNELQVQYQEDPEVRKILDMSMALEDLPRHASTHAAGVVICQNPLDEYLPLYYSESKGISTQFTKETVEELGLLKMDFLGLRNLTVIRNAIDLIKKKTGKAIDFNEMEFDDPKVFKMISEGNTQGVFQLESVGMTAFMKELKPTCFEDIVAGIALYRPGPMDSIPKYIHNKKYPKDINYVDDSLAHILDVTYGCIIYQEQVMQIVRELGGFSYGRSDLVRRTMSKKNKEAMNAERENFVHGKKNEDGSVEIEGCISRGISEKAANTIFDDMASFAEYAFNKSHAVAYAAISYQTAYIKCYYPVEYMAALMTSMIGDEAHISSYIRNCKEMGIEILPPSIKESYGEFTAEYDFNKEGKKTNGVRFGLLGIKHVGSGIVNSIIKSREKYGSPNDIYEFVANLDVKELNKRAIESLIKSGAMDCLNDNRASMMMVYENAVSSAQLSARNSTKDQISIFQLDDKVKEEVSLARDLPKVKNFDKNALLAMEKEELGVYISGHPLDDYKELLNRNVNCYSSDLTIKKGDENIENQGQDGIEYQQEKKFRDGDKVIIAGMLTGVKKMMTKKGQEMARSLIEDYYGTINLIFFPETFQRNRNLIKEDSIVAIKGKINYQSEGEADILVEKIDLVENISELKQDKKVGPLKIKISTDIRDDAGGDRAILEKIFELLSNYPGNRDVLIYLPMRKATKLGTKHRINLTEELKDKLVKWFGEKNIKE